MIDPRIIEDPTAMPMVGQRLFTALKAFESRRGSRVADHKLGAMVGMSKDQISALMSGERKTFTVAEAWKLAEVLGCDPCWLAFGHGAPPSAVPAGELMKPHIVQGKGGRRRA